MRLEISSVRFRPFCWDVLTYPLTTKRTSPKVMLTRGSIFVSSEVCWANLRDYSVCAVLRMWRLFFNNPFRPGSRKVVYCLHWKWMSQRNHDKMSTHDVSRDFVRFRQLLTHWGRMTHICVSKLTSIGSDNGLSSDRRQAIIWTNAGILLIRSWGTNFDETFITIYTFSFTKMLLKMSSGKWRPFCLGLNVL